MGVIHSKNMVLMSAVLLPLLLLIAQGGIFFNGAASKSNYQSALTPTRYAPQIPLATVATTSMLSTSDALDYALLGIVFAVIVALALITNQKKRNGKSTSRLQSAIEFISIYGWVLILIIVVIAVVAILALNKGPSTYTPSTCYISATFICQQLFVMSNSSGTTILLSFTNNLGEETYFPQEAFKVEPGLTSAVYTGNCYPANAVPGSTVNCEAVIPTYVSQLGSQTSPKFSVSYNVCPTSSQCSTNKFNSTGTSTSYVSGITPTYPVEFLTSTDTGGIAFDGVTYPPGTVVLFISTKVYNISAVVPKGLKFMNWNTSGGVMVPISEASLQNAVASANATGTLKAVFNTSSGTVNLTFQYPTVPQGSPDIGTAVGPAGDTILICGTSSTGGTSTHVCPSPTNYQLASHTQTTTYDTDSLPSGIYTFTACDQTYYNNNHNKQLCSPTQQVVVEPQVNLTIEYSSVYSGKTDLANATTSGASDVVILCTNSSMDPANLVYSCTSGVNYQVGNATQKFSTDIGKNPAYTPGDYQFVACDLTFYEETAGAHQDCSSIGELSVLSGAAPVLFIYGPNSTNVNRAAIIDGDDCPSSFKNKGYLCYGSNLTSDTVVLCATPNTGASPVAECPKSQGPPIDRLYATGPLLQGWVQADTKYVLNQTTQTYFDLNVGKYQWQACDLTWYTDTGQKDCSAVLNMTITPSHLAGAYYCTSGGDESILGGDPQINCVNQYDAYNLTLQSGVLGWTQYSSTGYTAGAPLLLQVCAQSGGTIGGALNIWCVSAYGGTYSQTQRMNITGPWGLGGSPSVIKSATDNVSACTAGTWTNFTCMLNSGTYTLSVIPGSNPGGWSWSKVATSPGIDTIACAQNGTSTTGIYCIGNSYTKELDNVSGVWNNVASTPPQAASAECAAALNSQIYCVTNGGTYALEAQSSGTYSLGWVDIAPTPVPSTSGFIYLCVDASGSQLSCLIDTGNSDPSGFYNLNGGTWSYYFAPPPNN